MLTCTGDLSRNREVGVRLAKGKPLETVLAELGHVSEGVASAQAALAHARDHHVEMPITEAVCAVLFEKLAPRTAVQHCSHATRRVSLSWIAEEAREKTEVDAFA